MSHKRPWILDYAVYLAVRLTVCVIQAVPWSWAVAAADGLARLAYRINRRHREVARDNLRAAFPERTDADIDRLVRAVYRHLFLVVMEMIFLPRRMHLATLDRHVDYAVPGDFDRVIGLIGLNRPIIVLTGHFGNWEVLSYVLGLAGYRGGVVARPLDNPYLDRFVHQFRSRTGQTLHAKKGAFDDIQDSLTDGDGLGVLADQDAGPRGVFVDFFGRPASTFKAIALLSLEYRAPILVLAAARASDDLKFTLYVGDMIFPEEYDTAPDAIRAITQRYTTALERIVRNHPDQYFWLHRRWKHQPAARKGKRAA
ncbi:MAG: lysophospholipid acyltransferase family protein [Gemmataceae bacterium]